MRHLAAGLGLTGLILGVVWPVFGPKAAVAAGALGLLASAVHVTAVMILRPALVPPFEALWKRWAVGLGLRAGGVALFATALFTARDWFPPLPSAIGFLGVLIPLLFGEMRMLLRAMRRTTDLRGTRTSE